MLNLLLNLLMLLAIVLTIFLIVIALIAGLTFTIALIGKIVDIRKGDGKPKGGGN